MSILSIRHYPVAVWLSPLAALLLLVTLLPAASAAETDDPDAWPGWELLSTTAIGAADFIAANPGFDGGGAVLAVMDTGVDMGIPGFSLYPGVWVELDYNLGSAPTVAPVGYQHFGVIRMIDGADGTEKGRLPVTWDFRP